MAFLTHYLSSSSDHVRQGGLAPRYLAFAVICVSMAAIAFPVGLLAWFFEKKRLPTNIGTSAITAFSLVWLVTTIPPYQNHDRTADRKRVMDILDKTIGRHGVIGTFQEAYAYPALSGRTDRMYYAISHDWRINRMPWEKHLIKEQDYMFLALSWDNSYTGKEPYLLEHGAVLKRKPFPAVEELNLGVFGYEVLKEGLLETSVSPAITGKGINCEEVREVSVDRATDENVKLLIKFHHDLKKLPNLVDAGSGMSIPVKFYEDIMEADLGPVQTVRLEIPDPLPEYCIVRAVAALSEPSRKASKNIQLFEFSIQRLFTFSFGQDFK